MSISTNTARRAGHFCLRPSPQRQAAITPLEAALCCSWAGQYQQISLATGMGEGCHGNTHRQQQCQSSGICSRPKLTGGTSEGADRDKEGRAGDCDWLEDKCLRCLWSIRCWIVFVSEQPLWDLSLSVSPLLLKADNVSRLFPANRVSTGLAA